MPILRFIAGNQSNSGLADDHDFRIAIANIYLARSHDLKLKSVLTYADLSIQNISLNIMSQQQILIWCIENSFSRTDRRCRNPTMQSQMNSRLMNGTYSRWEKGSLCQDEHDLPHDPWQIGRQAMSDLGEDAGGSSSYVTWWRISQMLLLLHK